MKPPKTVCCFAYSNAYTGNKVSLTALLFTVLMEMDVFIARVFATACLDWMRLPRPLFWWPAQLFNHCSACMIHLKIVINDVEKISKPS